jgi:hypothetical protein
MGWGKTISLTNWNIFNAPALDTQSSEFKQFLGRADQILDLAGSPVIDCLDPRSRHRAAEFAERKLRNLAGEDRGERANLADP